MMSCSRTWCAAFILTPKELNWSWCFQNQKCTKTTEVKITAISWTGHAERWNGFIYTSNNDEQYSNGFYYASHADDVLEGGERVSMASYGLNHYQHLNKAAFLGCANLDKTTHWTLAQVLWSKWLGLAWVRGENGRQHWTTKRFINSFPRCSVRVRGNNNKQVYIIPDVGCAEYLKQHYFPRCRIKPAMIKLKGKKQI